MAYPMYGETSGSQPATYDRLHQDGFLAVAKAESGNHSPVDPRDWYQEQIDQSPYDQTTVDLALGWWNRRGDVVGTVLANGERDPRAAGSQANEDQLNAQEFYAIDLAELSSPSVIYTFAVLERETRRREQANEIYGTIFDREKHFSMAALHAALEQLLTGPESFKTHDGNATIATKSSAKTDALHVVSRQSEADVHHYDIKQTDIRRGDLDIRVTFDCHKANMAGEVFIPLTAAQLDAKHAGDRTIKRPQHTPLTPSQALHYADMLRP